MFTKIKRILLPLIGIVLAGIISSCTDLREKDVPRLKQEAQGGNIDAMKTLYCWSRDYNNEFITNKWSDLLDHETRMEYRQILADHGYRNALDDLMETEGGKDPSERVRRKWLLYGANHGCVPYMLELGDSDESPEQADYWNRVAADSAGCAIANMRIKRASGSNFNVFTRGWYFCKEGWQVNEGGGFLSQASNSVIYFVSNYVADMFKFLFSNNWWQGLIALVLFVLFIIGVLSLFNHVYEGYGECSALPMLWTALYGAFNGFFLLINNWGGAIGDNWIGGYNELALNVGRFTLRPSYYSQQSDLCLYISWGWLIGFIIIVLLAILKQNNMSAKRFGVIILSCIVGYVFGLIFSLIVIVVASFAIVKTAASISTSPGAVFSNRDGVPDPVGTATADGRHVIINEEGKRVYLTPPTNPNSDAWEGSDGRTYHR